MQVSKAQSGAERGRWWQRRWLKVVASVCLLACLGLAIAAEYVLRHAEPILRKRIIETLSDRFDAPVELDRIDISLFKGIEVSGTGLRIPFGAGIKNAPSYPMIAVQEFHFRTAFRSLLRQPTHVAEVQVQGMEIHIPPPEDRKLILGSREGKKPADPGNPKIKPKVAIVVNELRCRDVRLYVESGKPGKDPLFFNIGTLDMRDVGRDQAMLYEAELINPKPSGLIHAKGHFGPWAGATPAGESTPDPGATPLDGDYIFDHADLNTIRGIGGTLSSAGHFSGVLDRITIDGTTDTPDFSLDISNRPVPLHTTFHAIVDGTNGDTYLNPVHARLENSDFTTAGKVVKVKGQGHDIQLDVDIPHGRMQDFLRMAIKTEPPLMKGTLAMKARLHIPPGHERVPLKMQMNGTFQMTGIEFNNRRWQDRLDGLSARAQGRPKEVAEVSHDHETEVHSRMAAHFTMGRGLIAVTDVRYGLPGALVLLDGVYSMDGRLFEFKGHIRTDATASQMVGGWKGWLLKPLDPLLQKHGAGLELPIEIIGTQGDMHFGLAMHGTDQTPQEMLADVKDRQRQKQRDQAARKLAAEAESEDAEAARAPTLEAAERAHNAAVRHRAEAEARLQDARKASTPQ